MKVIELKTPKKKKNVMHEKEKNEMNKQKTNERLEEGKKANN